MGTFIDLTGQKFDRLTVIEKAEKLRGRTAWKCRCDCGKEIIATSNALRTGNTKSCGCLQRDKARVSYSTKHGQHKTKLYYVWTGMKKRCFNPKHYAYHNYGGRGISVCDEWKDDFLAFREWAYSTGYREGLSIDRIDNDGEYAPQNCRWATKKEQANNTRLNHYVVYNGKRYTISELADMAGIPYARVLERLNRGWPIESVVDPEDNRYKIK